MFQHRLVVCTVKLEQLATFKSSVLLLVIVAMVFCASLVRANEQSAACHSLVAQSNSSDTNLLCAGLLPSGLLLITKDFYVYQIAHSAMDSADTLYLGSSPELIKDKWPTLYKNERFQEISTGDLIYNSFTVQNSNNEFIFFTTKKANTDKFGVTYDITEDVVHGGVTYRDADDQVLISSSEELLLYAINKPKGLLQICKFRFAKEDVSASDIGPEGNWQKMCAAESGEGTEIYLSETDCAKPIDWAVYRGFIDKGQFFLFAPEFIYIFDLDVVHQTETKHKVTKKQYDGFFICHVDWAKWLIILVLILLALLLLAALIYFCCCNRKKPKEGYVGKPTNKSTKKSKKSKGTKSVNPFSFAGGEATGRSKFSKKSKSAKKSKSNKSAMASKFTSGNNQATGRSAFHSKSKKK